MFRKGLIVAAAALLPFASFAVGQGGGNPNIPEIDGAQALLGIALLGGVISMIKGRSKK